MLYVRKTAMAFAFLLLGTISISGQTELLTQARQLYLEQENTDQALVLVDKYLASNPNDPVAYQDKGMYIRQLGIGHKNQAQIRESIDLFAKSLSLTDKESPNRIILFGQFATSYIELGDFKNARKYYTMCYKFTNRFFYQARISYCYARENKSDSAFTILNSATEPMITTADSRGNEGLTPKSVRKTLAF
jgi:tetratricopeptide (TPR) repeat protein